MRNFVKISSGLDMVPLQLELARQPQLWGQRDFRTTFDHSPHQDIQDIWLRFNQDPKGLDANTRAEGVVWYPEAQLFPALAGLVLPLLHYTKSWTLERLILTRLPPGGRILPHSDDKGPYVNQKGINRYHLVVQGLPGSLFKDGEEVVQMLTGEAWWFNPKAEHECMNNSLDDRIHLLVDAKTWPGMESEA